MPYRADLDALEARYRALAAEAADATRRRDEARSVLDDARERARFRRIAALRVASPCNEPWSEMPGDDRVRACARCLLNAYNLSAMTLVEANALVTRTEGRVCVRYFQRADGTILLADCSVGRSQRRRRRFAAAGIAASLAGIAGANAMREPAPRMDAVEPLPETELAPPIDHEPIAIMGDFAQTDTIPPTPSWLEWRDVPDHPDPPPRVRMKL